MRIEGGRRGLVGLLAAAPLAVLPATARAEAVPAECSNLQSTINTVAATATHGEGTTIVLTGMCDAGSLGSSAGVVLPAGSNFSIEGAPGTTSGFDGAGMSASMLGSGSEEVGSMALNGLTFQHANTTGDGGALALRAKTSVVLHADSFLENTTTGVVGGAAFVYIGNKQLACPPPSGAPAITVTGSTFRGNKLVVGGGVGGGAAAWLLDECESAPSVLEGDVFEGNTLEANGSSQVLGGALELVAPGKAHPTPARQTANVFDSNRIVAVSAAGDYGGGGEWLEGVSLTSVGDRFSRNTIAGTSGSNWSWGGGLGVLNTTCNAATSTESTLENDVIEGNSIGPGTPADLGGAGIYVGCGPSSTNPNRLRLLDSTVTENSVPTGGVAGIDGSPGDHLEIANSIVASDLGGNEIGGFNGTGGSLAASFSDICAAGSTSPQPGEGNICANPRLADEGKPESADVHETAGSPTIDVGSDALVPSGLIADFYGDPRLLLGHSIGVGCGPFTLPPAIVDIGAHEFGPGRAIQIADCAIPRSFFLFPSVRQLSAGRLTLGFRSLAAGHLTVLATFKRTRQFTRRGHGLRKIGHRTEPVIYARASHTSVSRASLSLLLSPTKRGLAVLKVRRRLQLTITITFARPSLSPSTQTKRLLVTYKPSRHHRRRTHTDRSPSCCARARAATR